MVTNPLWYDATVNAAVDAVASRLNGGFIKIYTGSQPALNGGVTGTLLASLPFANPAFQNSVAQSGTVTAQANTISSASAGNGGTAGYFALVRSDGTTIVMTGTVGISGADLNFSSIVIVFGATVSCSSFTISQRQT